MMKQVFYLFAMMFFFFSCSEIEEVVSKPPTVTYPQSNFEADFFTNGQSSTPQVRWNGNKGSFSLNASVNGLSVNSSTGQVSWSPVLPPGSHDFTVVASNASGQVSTQMTITNPLKGEFEGYYQYNKDGPEIYYAIELFENGTMKILANDEADPDVGEGTWQRDGRELVGDYEYENYEKYSLRLQLSQTNSTASLEGKYYFNHGSKEENYGGDLKLEM